jgi:paraquat-inducible protein A
MLSGPLELIGCSSCGTFQRIPQVTDQCALSCITCHTQIERTRWCSRAATLALSITAFALLFPANLLPFLTTSILGASRTSHLSSSATSMLGDGYPLLAVVVGLFVVVLPFLRFGLLISVLGSLQLSRHPSWLGRAFRVANELQRWSMPDVFLLGLFVAYVRLRASIDVQVELGADCFIAVGLLAMLVRATLDRAEIWREIGPDRTQLEHGAMLSCPGCDLVMPVAAAGNRCPRCEARLWRRKPETMVRALALTLAGVLLYFPANLYPIATIPIGLTSLKYNILGGAIELIQLNLYGFAAIVIIASFAIPILKLAGLSWCIVSVRRRSSRWLRQKTRLYEVIAEIGRWSMVDPFVIAVFVPVSRYSSLVYGHAEPAAQVFTAVVILTIIAADCFDPRLMWDYAGKPA